MAASVRKMMAWRCSDYRIFYKQSRAIITMVLSLRRVNMTVIRETNSLDWYRPQGTHYWKSLPGSVEGGMLSTNITRLA
jgi:hypothetical protein